MKTTDLDRLKIRLQKVEAKYLKRQPDNIRRRSNLLKRIQGLRDQIKAIRT